MTFGKLTRLEMYCASDLSVACYHPKSLSLGRAIVEEGGMDEAVRNQLHMADLCRPCSKNRDSYICCRNGVMLKDLKAVDLKTSK